MVAQKEGRMRQNSKLMLAVLLLVCIGFAATRTEVSAGSHFVPPDITAASDVPYPIDNVASGLVSIAVNLTAGGQVQNVQAVRDIPGLTAVVSNAVNTWTFSPGKLDGNAVPSTINVQVLFNPGTVQNQNLQLSPGALVTPPIPPGYMPPQMSQVSYAVYPPNSVATGAVVLDLLINKYSEVKKVTPIRLVPSLTEAAIAAVKTWTVNPATLNEKKLDAKLVVAFVFRSPTISTP
jgi:Gram-negative bacterial TonB protein C-terminal